jgi:hypothetical protein
MPHKLNTLLITTQTDSSTARAMRTMLLVTLAGMLTACATAPTGPSSLVLPGAGKSFESFRYDDFECRNFASTQSGSQAADQARQDSAVRGAVLGTAVGAIAGAAIGGQRGAGVGAGTGLIVGTASGASSASGDSYSAQRRYDNAYIQCMYAKGHRVPVDGRLSEAPGARPGAAIPPPPAGTPPPPPAGVLR